MKKFFVQGFILVTFGLLITVFFPVAPASANSLNTGTDLPSLTVGRDFNGRKPGLTVHYQLESSGPENIILYGSDGGNSDPSGADLDYLLREHFKDFDLDAGDWK
ncbi:hypothetical protein [Levilactobacillus koreensis]|uniref:Uncharacterized protein n=1 Tax=Levilactobacillus koreensis TaxID=637971 RepID=A0AAC9ER22_9LACO|nr:hypothetical protein [Levilactobacillus koreensis]AKP64709.1 hypothetical protein ABN16_06660 [Levilactobacillus koreensis]